MSLPRSLCVILHLTCKLLNYRKRGMILIEQIERRLYYCNISIIILQNKIKFVYKLRIFLDGALNWYLTLNFTLHLHHGVSSSRSMWFFTIHTKTKYPYIELIQIHWIGWNTFDRLNIVITRLLSGHATPIICLIV